MCKYPPLADYLVLAIVLPPKQQSIWSVSGTCNTVSCDTFYTVRINPIWCWDQVSQACQLIICECRARQTVVTSPFLVLSENSLHSLLTERDQMYAHTMQTHIHMHCMDMLILKHAL